MTTTTTATINPVYKSINTHNTMKPVNNPSIIPDVLPHLDFDIVTAINETITRIYDKPDPVPFTGDIWQWLAANNIHVAIATNAVKWQAYGQHEYRDSVDRKTEDVARAILNGQKTVHDMDDCIDDCFTGLKTYAETYGLDACYHFPAIGDETVYTPVLHRDFVRAGFRAVSNGMRAMGSRSAVHQTAIETKDDSGQWIEVSTASVPALARYTAWECDIMVADIVRNIADNLPTDSHRQWLYCRLDGYKKVEIEKELGVTRQKCREIEKAVIAIGQKVVDYYDLFA